MFKSILVSLDDEAFEITRTWGNISKQIRDLIKEHNEGVKPLCLYCGKILIMIIGTTMLECKECNKKFQLIKKKD